ncbi:MAG: helix-turn-helix transcriptional regulator [Ruminococcus sp.]|nr:helix-turn-helix transcriptional regulator [Ruminococcus sp.]
MANTVNNKNVDFNAVEEHEKFKLRLLEQQIEAKMELRRKRLNEVMQTKHITLEELGKLTGVPKSSIQRYLTGETKKIPIDFFEKVSQVTDTPVEYLSCFDVDRIFNRDYMTGNMEEFLESEKQRMKEAASDPRSGISTKLDKLSDSQLDRLIGYLEALLAE